MPNQRQGIDNQLINVPREQDQADDNNNATSIVEENRARRLRQAVLDAKIKERVGGGTSGAQKVDANVKTAKKVVKIARTARLVYAGCGCCSCLLPLLMWLVIFLIIAMAATQTWEVFKLLGGEALKWLSDIFH